MTPYDVTDQLDKELLRLETNLAQTLRREFERLRGLPDESYLAENVDDTMAVFGDRLGSALENNYFAAMQVHADLLKAKKFQKAATEVFSFDVGRAKQVQSAVIGPQLATSVREVTENTKAAIRQATMDQIAAGQNPIKAARRIKEYIGLTSKQMGIVRNYETQLRNLDPNALRRQLRYKGSDGMISEHIQRGAKLSDSQIKTLTDRYSKRLLGKRTKDIARTESTRAMGQSGRDMMRQMVVDGDISYDRVRRFWKYSYDSKTREAHQLIPSLNPDGVGLDEPFQTPLGPMMYPGDPRGTAANTINCRCTVFNRILPLTQTGAPDLAGAPPPPVSYPNSAELMPLVSSDAPQRLEGAFRLARAKCLSVTKASPVKASHMVVLNTVGDVVQESTGTKSVVKIPDIKALDKAPEGSLVVHKSTPEFTPLSVDDYSKMAQNTAIAAVFTHGTDSKVSMIGTIPRNAVTVWRSSSTVDELRRIWHSLSIELRIRASGTPDLKMLAAYSVWAEVLKRAGLSDYKVVEFDPNTQVDVDAALVFGDISKVINKYVTRVKSTVKNISKALTRRDETFVTYPSYFAPVEAWQDFFDDLSGADVSNAEKIKLGAFTINVLASKTEPS